MWESNIKKILSNRISDNFQSDFNRLDISFDTIFFVISNVLINNSIKSD